MQAVVLRGMLIAFSAALAAGTPANAAGSGGQAPAERLSPPPVLPTDVEFPACCYRDGRYWQASTMRECARSSGYVVQHNYCASGGPPPPAELVCCRSGDRFLMVTKMRCDVERGRAVADRACRAPMPPPGAPVCCRRGNYIWTAPKTACTHKHGGVMIRAKHCRAETGPPPAALVCCIVGGDMIMELTEQQCRKMPGKVDPEACD